MKIKFWSGVVALFIGMQPVVVLAGKTTYVFTDRRVKFVKRVELSKGDLKALGKLAHPYPLTTEQVSRIFGNIKLSHKFLLSKEIETEEIFDDSAISFLAPLLAQAFREAKSNEQIVFSYLDKNPKLILRNDRVTIAALWITDDQILHIQFTKLMAKMFGDYDKRSGISQAVNQAKGLRMALESAPGYELGKSVDELLVHLPQVLAGMEAESAAEAGAGEMKASKKIVTADDKVTEQRLKNLEKLKKKGLITDEEYQKKREEILKDL